VKQSKRRKDLFGLTVLEILVHCQLALLLLGLWQSGNITAEDSCSTHGSQEAEKVREEGAVENK
jgi:hypothetical protein